MTTLWRCINGHEWHTESSSLSGACPECGISELDLPSGPTHPENRATGLAENADSVPCLSRYEILDQIGEGGMGVVYRARHRQTDQLVAIKFIRKERLSSPELVSRFRREAMAAARLQHAGIVQLYEADFDRDPPYLVMEFVPGITLQKLVEETGPLPVAQACEFIRQTAVALQHAAEMHLVHRDIKPSNLMVLAPNGLPLPPRPVIKILDMGVARLVQLSEKDASLTTLTRDGCVIGTPDFIPPEQLENPREVDIRADLYSLGCTGYFLLSGKVPFPGGNLIQKLDKQRWGVAPSVNTLRPEVPATLAAVIRKLMAKHPDDRFQTPGELASALQTLQSTGTLPGSFQPHPLVSLATLTGHTGSVTAVAFAADGRSLYSGSVDRTIRVWDVATRQQRGQLGDGKYPIDCLTVVPRTGLILAGQGATVRGYDPSTGREVFRLTGHNNAVRVIAVSSDGRRAVTGSDDRTARLWDLERGREMGRFSRHHAGVTGVALLPDGQRVLSASHDQPLRLWEATSGRELASFPVPKGSVLCLVLAADGKGIYSGHFDTTLRLWDTQTGAERRRFSGHKRKVSGIAATTDGRVFSVSSDQTVRLWDEASGAELSVGQGHTAAVTAVALSGDGTLLATASADQTVRLWSVPG